MSVTINIPPFIQNFTDKKGEMVATGKTVIECLTELVEHFPRSKEYIFNEQGKLLSHIGIFLNGDSLMTEELGQEVHDGDHLAIVNLVAGG